MSLPMSFNVHRFCCAQQKNDIWRACYYKYYSILRDYVIDVVNVVAKILFILKSLLISVSKIKRKIFFY